MPESEKDKLTEESIKKMAESFARNAFPTQMLETDLNKLTTKAWEEGLTSEEYEKLDSHIRRLKLSGWAPTCMHRWRGREAQRRLGLIPTPAVMWVLTFPRELALQDDPPERIEWNLNYMSGPFLTQEEAIENEKRYVADMQVRPVRQPGEQVLKTALQNPEMVRKSTVPTTDEAALIPRHEEELLLKLLKEGQPITREESQKLTVHIHLLAASWHRWHAECFFNFHHYRPYHDQVNKIEDDRGVNPDRQEWDAYDPLYVVELGAPGEGDLIGPFDTRVNAEEYKETIGAPDLKIYCLRTK